MDSRPSTFYVVRTEAKASNEAVTDFERALPKRTVIALAILVVVAGLIFFISQVSSFPNKLVSENSKKLLMSNYFLIKLFR